MLSRAHTRRRRLTLVMSGMIAFFALGASTFVAVRYYRRPRTPASSARIPKTLSYPTEAIAMSTDFFAITSSQFTKWVYGLECQHAFLSGMCRVNTQHCRIARPQEGVVYPLRVMVEPNEVCDFDYWKEYNRRTEEMQSWLDRQRPRIDDIKDFASERFPDIQFEVLNIPPNAPAPLYPKLPLASPNDASLAPSPPPIVHRRHLSWRGLREPRKTADEPLTRNQTPTSTRPIEFLPAAKPPFVPALK
jgi:hypothetical protein